MWLRPSARKRDAPPLSRDRIVEEAVTLLDTEGADRLTMRRLAERLGTGSTTLYWHVKTKDDVLDLALDAIFAEVEIPPEGGQGWRAGITALINGWRAVLLRHPWSAALLSRPMLGPNVLARSEFMYATLLQAGVVEPHLTAAAYGLSNYAIGSGLMQATWPANAEQDVRSAARERLHANRERYRPSPPMAPLPWKAIGTPASLSAWTGSSTASRPASPEREREAAEGAHRGGGRFVPRRPRIGPCP